MPATEPIYIGIDLGTGGVRAVAVTGEGEVVAEAATAWLQEPIAANDDRHEQDASHWWHDTKQVIQDLVGSLDDAGRNPQCIDSIAVDGTSGTIVPVDTNGACIGRAIMYNDGRAAAEAAELTALAQQGGGDVVIASSYAIARIRWLQRHQLDLFDRTFRFAHHADFVQWQLLRSCQVGVACTTDYSNALKTGYDLRAEAWPDWLTADESIARRLPDVVAPGTVLGTIDSKVASQLRLSEGVRVVAGCSDGTAGFLASGAKDVGDDNTTLGTTLVFKRIADAAVNNELVYSHKLPGNRWLPGAASNTGGEWIRQQFPNAKLAELDADARRLLPVDVLAYPIARTGERFPFKHSMAASFIEPAVNDDIKRYAAMLQGTALFERLCYEQLNQETGMTADQLGEVYATGGGAKSDVWLQLRANVTGRTYHVPAYPESAMGAAILAATGATEQPLWETIDRMVCIERTYSPNLAHREHFDSLFDRFKKRLGVWKD